MYWDGQRIVKSILAGDKLKPARAAKLLAKTTGLGRDVLGLTGNYEANRSKKKKKIVKGLLRLLQQELLLETSENRMAKTSPPPTHNTLEITSCCSA